MLNGYTASPGQVVINIGASIILHRPVHSKQSHSQAQLSWARRVPDLK